LTVALAASGNTVTVITSRQRYDDPNIQLPARSRHENVEIIRLWTTRFGRLNLAGRAIDYLTFYFSAIWQLLRHVHKNDVVIAKTDPPMLSVVAGPITWLKGAKLVNWLQDLFPEVAMAAGPGNDGAMGPLYRAMKVLRDRSLRAADMNVVLGDRMAVRVANLGVEPHKIRIISNWADADLLHPIPHAQNALRQDWGLHEKFVVGYSGNLGRAHEYATFLDAIAEIERQPQRNLPVVWLFIGGGALYKDFVRETVQRGLTSVVFKPYQPRERLSESLSAADVHLVSLRPDMEGLIVPSKFHGITAVARPAIFIGDADGEIARLIARYHCGAIVAPGDGKALARTISALAEDPARRVELGRHARAAFEVNGGNSWRRLQAAPNREVFYATINCRRSRTLRTFCCHWGRPPRRVQACRPTR